jgi:hypothetical protein
MADSDRERRSDGGAADDGLLANLPATRPARLSRRGREASRPADAEPEKEARRPRAVRAAAPNLSEPAVKAAARREPESKEGPSATEVVTTVVQAAGELVQIGVTIGGQILRRAVDRLPTKL